MIIIDELSTEELIHHLRDFGVDITKAQFLEEVHEFHSASDLADHWWDMYPITAVGHEEDFIWLAANELWDRLAPEVVRAEQLHKLIQEGYDLRAVENHTEACNRWLEVWAKLQAAASEEGLTDIRTADYLFPGFYSFANWCQDVESELQRAANADPTYHEHRRAYCQEFCDVFPDTSPQLLQKMKTAEATSLFALGRIDDGEQAFEALITEYPTYAVAYLRWGDMYWRTRPNEAIPHDYDTAEAIYRRGLSREVDRTEALADRLDELEAERASDHQSPS